MMACSPCADPEDLAGIESEEEYEEDARGMGSKDADISWKNWMNLAAYILNSAVTYSSLTGIFGATNTELSKKYQTLVTPAGWAFSIWGPIFLWEAVFVVAQFFPRFRSSKTVVRISPWWWALCVFQTAWTLVFAQDLIAIALLFMLGILASFLGIAWTTDGLEMSVAEYFLLRAPMSLQLGWIIVASTLNLNVLADSVKAPQETLLALAVLSYAAVLAIAAVFTLAVKSPDPFIGIVAAWAFGAISSELKNPVALNDPGRFNPSTWDMVTLGGMQKAALGICLSSAAMGVIAIVFRILAACYDDSESEAVGDEGME